MAQIVQIVWVMQLITCSPPNVRTLGERKCQDCQAVQRALRIPICNIGCTTTRTLICYIKSTDGEFPGEFPRFPFHGKMLHVYHSICRPGSAAPYELPDSLDVSLRPTFRRSDVRGRASEQLHSPNYLDDLGHARTFSLVFIGLTPHNPDG